MAEKKHSIFNRIHLEPDNLTYAEILGNSKRYSIPQFQRDYSWEHTEWQELWDDVLRIKKTETQHFMGYLVLQTEDGKFFNVIDGQQRFTTLALIVIAAINRLQKIGENEERKQNQERQELLQEKFLQGKDLTLTYFPKLTLNRHNNIHFQDLVREKQIIVQRNITKTHRSMMNAFKFFQNRFQEYKNGEDIIDVMRIIEDGLLFTTITVNDELDAYIIFETLNARGIHLSTPDLLKNYLMSVLAKEERSEHYFEVCEEQWDEILKQLGVTNFTNFLRSYIGMKKDLPSKKELFRFLKKNIQQSEQVIPYIADLKKYAAVFAALQNENDNFWKESQGTYIEAKNYLTLLNIFNIKTPLSLLMTGFEKLSAPNFLALLRYISICTIRYNIICNKLPNIQEAIYNNIANELMNEKISFKDIVFKLKAVYPDDTEFVAAFVEKTMPSRQYSKKIIYLLSQIERYVKNGKTTTIETSDVTLEHILPYIPDNNWQENFGINNYLNAIDRLGNMALLTKKQNMGQENFTEKKEILLNSQCAINQHIAEYDEWNFENVEKHQKWLAQQAKIIWKISQLDG